MGTQTKIAEKIIEKKADYVLALKGNQKNLHIVRKDTSIPMHSLKSKRYAASLSVDTLEQLLVKNII